MQTKLTLRVDEKLVKKAKAYAKKTGKSVSQLVAEYFSLLSPRPESERELTPAVRRLKGALKGGKSGAADYKTYLEEKHL